MSFVIFRDLLLLNGTSPLTGNHNVSKYLMWFPVNAFVFNSQLPQEIAN